MQGKKVLALMAAATLLLGACKRETKDEKFRREFQQFTEKECPKQIDPYTRQDSVVYDIPSRTLCYYYTVMGDLDVDSIYTKEVIENVREETLKGLKSSIQYKPYKDEGINFHHNYRSTTTGKTLLEMAFTPDDYRN